MAKRSDLEKAHGRCHHHRVEIQQSDYCACFSCFNTFDPDDIAEWVDHGQTAVCPQCGRDAVLGTASGFPLTSKFLRQMQQRWLSTTKPG